MREAFRTILISQGSLSHNSGLTRSCCQNPPGPNSGSLWQDPGAKCPPSSVLVRAWAGGATCELYATGKSDPPFGENGDQSDPPPRWRLNSIFEFNRWRSLETQSCIEIATARGVALGLRESLGMLSVGHKLQQPG